MADVLPHNSNAVRALILLHERELRSFLATWKDAQAQRTQLPKCEDPNYASRESLLFHVLRAAQNYLVWICEKLELPRPELREPAPVEGIEDDCEAFTTELLAAWSSALTAVRDEQLEPQTFTSYWGTEYTIDAMLEHAVLHPLRHRFQLEQLR